MIEDDWAPHPRYSDIAVSSSGVILSYKRGFWHELRQSDNHSGYLRVGVGHGNPVYVHRLVAETYIPNPHGLPEVNHVDGDKHNNRSDNLEWSTASDNAKHAFANGLKVAKGYRVRVVETGEIFESVTACARAIGGNQSNIWKCLNFERRTHRGFTFEYV